MSVHENCDTCQVDYDITPDNARLILFLDYLRASHIEATCTNGHTEIIYVTTQVFLQVLMDAGLNIAFGLVPTDERRAACDATFDGLVLDELVYTSETEIDPPHYMLRELYDQLREFENTN